jgi:hypothetical protein
MSSIKFDSVELVNSTYIPRFIRHESAPLRDLSLLELAREDGAILVSERYGMKIITIKGKLTASTQAALETAIDSFKELFSGVGKNLDIEWEGSTRRYVATCQKHIFNRDFFHLLFVPWSAEFVVPSGIGEPTSEITHINNASFTAASKTGNFDFNGSAKPKPRFRLKCGAAATDPKGFSLENTDNGEKIVVTRSAGFGANKYFEIDCRLKTVKYDGVEIPFYKVFPQFEPGTNGYKIQVGEVLDQEFDGGQVLYDWEEIYSVGINDRIVRQSFTVPYKDTTYQALQLRLWKTAAGAVNLQVNIRDDAGAVIDQFNFTPADIPTGSVNHAWVKKYTNSGNPFTLEANQKYWLDVISIGTTQANRYNWLKRIGVSATYKRGSMKRSADSGATWTYKYDEDMYFKLYYGGKEDAAKTYYYDTFYFPRYL